MRPGRRPPAHQPCRPLWNPCSLRSTRCTRMGSAATALVQTADASRLLAAWTEIRTQRAGTLLVTPVAGTVSADNRDGQATWCCCPPTVPGSHHSASTWGELHRSASTTKRTTTGRPDTTYAQPSRHLSRSLPATSNWPPASRLSRGSLPVRRRTPRHRH